MAADADSILKELEAAPDDAVATRPGFVEDTLDRLRHPKLSDELIAELDETLQPYVEKLRALRD